MKHQTPFSNYPIKYAAAFGRLCVETISKGYSLCVAMQPPSGGCVLKLWHNLLIRNCYQQPPSGGCVLKHHYGFRKKYPQLQPPSGGCVLKLFLRTPPSRLLAAAAFGRLCVETLGYFKKVGIKSAAAFGRLCVETTLYLLNVFAKLRSRLRAAVC